MTESWYGHSTPAQILKPTLLEIVDISRMSLGSEHKVNPPIANVNVKTVDMVKSLRFFVFVKLYFLS